VIEGELLMVVVGMSFAKRGINAILGIYARC
jgi:hypothetical protein